MSIVYDQLTISVNDISDTFAKLTMNLTLKLLLLLLLIVILSFSIHYVCACVFESVSHLRLIDIINEKNSDYLNRFSCAEDSKFKSIYFEKLCNLNLILYY